MGRPSRTATARASLASTSMRVSPSKTSTAWNTPSVSAVNSAASKVRPSPVTTGTSTSMGSSGSPSVRCPSAMTVACGPRRNTGTQRSPSRSPSRSIGWRVRACMTSRRVRMSRIQRFLPGVTWRTSRHLMHETGGDYGSDVDLTAIGAVLLDMDGTLVDSDAAVERAWRTWAGEYGVDPAETIAGAHGSPADNTVRRMLPHLDADGVRSAAFRELELQYTDLDDVVALPGAPELLAD